MSSYHLVDTQSIFRTLEVPPKFNITHMKNKKTA